MLDESVKQWLQVIGVVLLVVVVTTVIGLAIYGVVKSKESFEDSYVTVISENGTLRRVPASMQQASEKPVEKAVLYPTPLPRTSTQIPQDLYLLKDGIGGLVDNLCSRSCCADQWPTPVKDRNDPYVCANKDKFVTSNIMCNNTFQDSGCMCLTKDQYNVLYE